jgi:type IV secretory pathway protease TraF
MPSAPFIARPRVSHLTWWLSSVATVAACWVAGLRLNLTGSLPVGLYLASHGVPGRGATVLVCLPSGVAAFAKVRGYVPQGARVRVGWSQSARSCGPSSSPAVGWWSGPMTLDHVDG